MKKKNMIASALGRLAAGKPKHYTQAELARRTARLAEASKKRWPQPAPNATRNAKKPIKPQ